MIQLSTIRKLSSKESMMEPLRSSHRRCSVRKGVLRNFGKFTEKYLCQRLFFNKVAGLKPATLLKNRFWHRCFPVSFAKFLRTPFLQNTSGQLLLSVEKVVLKNFAIFTGMHLCWGLFLIREKESPTQVLSWEYCEIFKNTYFKEHVQTAAT